jgi:hypothetical protein
VTREQIAHIKGLPEDSDFRFHFEADGSVSVVVLEPGKSTLILRQDGSRVSVDSAGMAAMWIPFGEKVA